MRKIILCTGNSGKIKEFQRMLPVDIRLLGLTDVGMPLDLPETGDSLEANALQKARYVFERTGENCLADDTGLEVLALNGSPGVLSARYAGIAKDDNANMAKLLQALDGVKDRRARFRTVLAYISPEGDHVFEGIVDGTIAHRKSGENGFGYDPVFIAAEHELTFAELEPQEKNRISHRARAVASLIEYLRV